MTDVVTGADGRTLSARGVETRQRLLDAAEHVFGELGYHDASIVKITEAAGVGPGHVLPLLRLEAGHLRRARPRPEPTHPPRDERGVVAGRDAARAGGARLPRRTSSSPSEHPGALQDHSPVRVRLAGHLPLALRPRLRAVRRGAPATRSTRGELGPIDPEVAAWALMAVGEMIGMRWIVWGDGERARRRRRRARADHPRASWSRVSDAASRSRRPPRTSPSAG